MAGEDEEDEVEEWLSSSEEEEGLEEIVKKAEAGGEDVEGEGLGMLGIGADGNRVVLGGRKRKARERVR